MDEFITGKIKTIDINKDDYGIVLSTAKDSTVMSIGYKEDLKADSTLLSKLQPGQEISIKGFILYFENPKRKEDVCVVEIKKIKLPS